MSLKQFYSICISFSLAFQPIILNATNIKVDNTAQENHKANISKARNGTPIVNIVNPNKNGLSHNKFSQYSVSKQNVILNNALKEVNTQLAGVIDRNKNLRKNARTILNEITGTSRTNLEGYTEVAGQKANVIIANPNGIYIKGGGFINVPQATLTTGKPMFDNEVLKSFNVKRGLVEIDGKEFNASNINQVDIYANAIKLNAKIYANNLSMITGNNKINVTSEGKYKNHENNQSGEKEQFALSSTLLGGIYGNKISLIGTKDGVGVNFPSEIMAQDDLNIDINGDIILNKAISKNSIDLKAKNIENNTIYAKNVKINSTGTLKNEKLLGSENSLYIEADTLINKGAIASGVDNTFSVHNKTSNPTKIVTNNLSNQGEIYSKNELSLVKKNKDTISTINNEGKILSSSKINLLSNNIINKEGEINSSDNLVLEANNIQANNGIFQSKKDIYFKVSNILNLNNSKITALDNIYINKDKEIGVKVQNDNVHLQANNNLMVNAESIKGTGSILYGNNIRVNSSYLNLENANFKAFTDLEINTNKQDITNSQFASNNNLDFTSKGDLTLDNQSSLKSLNKLNLKINNLNNYGNIIAAYNDNNNILGDVNIQTTNTLNNYALIQGANELILKSDLINNYGGLATQKDLKIYSSGLNNYNTIFSYNNMYLYVSNLLNQTDKNKVSDIDEALIYSMNNIYIQGDENKTTKTNEVINHNATIQTEKGDINFYANKIENKNDEAKIEKTLLDNRSMRLYGGYKGIYYDSYVYSYTTGSDAPESHYYFTLSKMYLIEKNIRKKYFDKYFSLDTTTIKKELNNYEFISFKEKCTAENRCHRHLGFFYETYYIDKNKYNPSAIFQQYKSELYSALKKEYAKYNLNVVKLHNNRTWKTSAEKRKDYRIGLNGDRRSIKKVGPYYGIKLGNANNDYSKLTPLVGSGDWSFKIRKEKGDIDYYIKGFKSHFTKRPENKEGSKILSGNNINIHSDTFTNYISTVSAKNDINFNNSEVKNQSMSAWDNEEILVTDYKSRRISAYSKAPNATPIETYNAVIEAGNNITGNIKSFENDELSNNDIHIKRSSKSVDNLIPSYKLSNNEKSDKKELSTDVSLSSNTSINNSSFTDTILNIKNKRRKDIDYTLNIKLPTNKYGLYVTNYNPKHKYLIESNPLYNTFSGYYNSDYFLNKMNFNPNVHIKRLGDATYENKLIRNAIVNHTGRQYSLSSESINEQYKNLMDNAINMATILDLDIGVTPTKEQLKNLTQDIVWLELRNVNGIDVLAPVVYFAKEYNKINGAVITANNNIDLNIEKDFTNTGTLKSNNLNLNANSITNNTGVIISDGVAKLISVNNITNKDGASIRAGELSLTSTEGSIINDTYVRKTRVGKRKNNTTYTISGNQSNIESTKGNLVLRAKNNINNNAAQIKSKASLGLYTQNGDININTKELENSSYSKRGSSSDKYKKIRHLESNLNAREKLVLNSGNKLNITASKIDAKGNIHLNAKDDVNILAVNNLDYRMKKRKSGGSFGRSSRSKKIAYKETVVSSDISGKNILMNSEKDITLEAAKLKADENILAEAKGNINVVAKEYKEGYLKFKSSKGFGGLSSKASMDIRDVLKLKEAKLQTQALNVILKSGKDINILASEVDAAADVQLEAFNKLLIAAGEELSKKEKIREKTSFNPLGLLNLVSPVDLGPIYTQEIKRNKNHDVNVKQSNIKAGKNIIAKTGSTKIVGSNLEAKDDIYIKSDIGSIEVVSAQEKKDAKSFEKKVEVSLSTITDAVKGVITQVADDVESSTDPEAEQNTKIKINVAKATYDKEETVSKETNSVASNLNSKNGNIVLNSSEDILIEGSNIKAIEDIVLNSELGNITIKEAVDKKDFAKKETHAKAEVNFTVQNEYVEIGTAIKAAALAAKQLKKVKDDYKKYKKQVKKLKSSLSKVKKEYREKVPGSSRDDIEDLQELLDDVKDDKKYYVAAIVAATADLTTKTLAIAQQAATAAASSGTYGFSAGISLDVQGEKSKTKDKSTINKASNLNAKNIYVKTDNTKDTQVNISGSNLIAKENIEIDTKDLNLLASQDTSSSEKDTKDISGSISTTMYGAAFGPRVSLGYGQQHSDTDSLKNNNTQIEANNININATNDANFIGANVKAKDTLNLNVKNDLVLESQRDIYNTNQNGFNVSAGFSIGGSNKDQGKDSKGKSTVASRETANQNVGLRTGNGKVSSVNASYGANTGRVRIKQTELTSLIGNKVNVNVGNNTHLKGSLLAAGKYDKTNTFVDNENLNLKTKTLTYANNTDTKYSTSNSFNVGASIGIADTKDDQGKDTTTSSVSSSSLAFSNKLGYQRDKTLATLGKGKVTITDKENSDDINSLNRDTQNLTKSQVDLNYGVEVDATLDHRLLTKKGQNQIAEDFLKTKMITDTIGEIATNQTVGIESFFDEVGKLNTTYETVKAKIAQDKTLANILNSPAYTDAQKDVILNGVTNEVLIQLGYKPVDTKLIATTQPGRDGKQVKGYNSLQTNGSYVNDLYNSNNYQLVASSGTEAQRAMDAQNGSKFDQSKEYRDDRSKYSQNFGSNIASYTDFALNYTGQGSLSTTANSLTNTNQVTSTPSIFNNQTSNNNIEFSGLDKELGDNFAPVVILGVLALQNYLNTPEDENDIKTGTTGSEYLLPIAGANIIYNGGKTALTTVGNVLSKTNAYVAGGTISGGIELGTQTYGNLQSNTPYDGEKLLKTSLLGVAKIPGTGYLITNCNVFISL